jgi:hypothetical protein
VHPFTAIIATEAPDFAIANCRENGAAESPECCNVSANGLVDAIDIALDRQGNSTTFVRVWILDI